MLIATNDTLYQMSAEHSFDCESEMARSKHPRHMSYYTTKARINGEKETPKTHVILHTKGKN